MNTGIHIEGAKVTRRGMEAVADSVTAIFASAAEHRMEQETVRVALGIVERVGGVNNVSVSGCNVRMDGGETRPSGLWTPEGRND
jgi:hypothetical protein